MRHTLSACLLFMSGVAAVLLGCELAFRVLPVSTATATGYWIDPMILTYPPHHRYRRATGWNLRNAYTVVVNNFGFVSDIDFRPDKNAVALIGDSYIEASMVPDAQRPGAQLQALLGPSRPVYAMGSPGTSLLDYAERLRFASQTLAVRDAVLFITAGDIRQSLCGSHNIHGPCLSPATLLPDTDRLPPPSTIKTWVGKSAFAQYLVSQLRVTPDQALPALPALLRSLVPGRMAAKPAAVSRATSSSTAPSTAAIDAVMHRFFERIRPYARGRLILVLHRPQPGEPRNDIDAESDRFADLARAEGATVVDMDEAYRAHAARSPLSLYMEPRDRHLNSLGISLVARAAAEALRSAPVRR